MASSSSGLHSSSSNAILLTEDDIPGASLLGRKPEELKTAELRLWLKCRGDSCKGLKTKAELVKRVHEYIRTGKDKDVVDPDPDKIYSRRKERSSITVNLTNEDGVSVQFPVNGWSTSLEKMPMFTRLEMNRHIMKSGKSIADKEHHTVPTALIKAKRFLDDEYLEDIQCASDQAYFFVKSKCCHSFRKHDQPHTLQIALCILSGEVRSACCSCVAGKLGFCNHVLALMFKLCKFSLFNCSTAKDLCEEDDQHVPLACTSQLQQWHKKGGGANIAPQPVMEVQVSKIKDDDGTSRSGLKCLLYEARMKTVHDKNAEQLLKNTLRNIDPNMGLSQMAGLETEDNYSRDTKFGPCRVGSYLSYQVAVTESNFKATASIDCIPRLQAPNKEGLNFPRFPLRNIETMEIPENLSEQELQLIDMLRVDEDQVNLTEKETRKQAECTRWKDERSFRFTASKFHLISKRQRNHENFADTLLNPKPVTSKYLEHGKKYEPVALVEYEKFMSSRRTPVKVLPCGFVVSQGIPIIGATPDARVIDFGCVDHFGLAEVKCPYTKHHVTPLDACSDPKFFMEKTTDTECKLKEDHPYYAQVQGQMAATGARWCDFIVYTSKGLYVQRIPFDPMFWRNLKQKLLSYYFTQFIKFASAKMHDGKCQVVSADSCMALQYVTATTSGT